MNKSRIIKNFKVLLLSLIGLLMMLSIAFSATASTRNVAAEALGGTYNLIDVSQSEDWSKVNADQGDFTVDKSAKTIAVNSFGTEFSTDGAIYTSSKGNPLGAFEMSTTINITEIDSTRDSATIGIMPWFFDKNNFLSVQFKLTPYALLDGAVDIRSEQEKQDGWSVEQLIVTGKLDGEDKYKDTINKEGNTVYATTTEPALKDHRKGVFDASGHTIKVRFENSSTSGLSYKLTFFYDNYQLSATTDIYYYMKAARPDSSGVMAQNIKGSFSNVIINDYYATHNTAVLARDWKQNNDFTYKVLNGKDVWTFNDNGSVSFDTTKTSDGKSEYSVSKTNFANYNTNRGFVVNPVATTNGLPQNYEIKAQFKADRIDPYTRPQEYRLGYGLIPWYKDDINFIDVTFRKTISGAVASPNETTELVLYGWIDGSTLPVGTNVYTLPKDFDLTENHTIRVEKKSIEFLVYLDDAVEPVIKKRIMGTGENFNYGYTSYNVKATAGAIESKAIYSAYDEISIYDNAGEVWKAAGKDSEAWAFGANSLTLNGKETSSTLTKTSHLIGASDIFAANIEVKAKMSVSMGDASQFSMIMISPYMVDDDNYVKIGFAFKNGKTYARTESSVYTEEMGNNGDEPIVLYKQTEISSLNLSGENTYSVKKIGNTVTLSVNDSIVYGKEYAGIEFKTPEYGLYAYNVNLNITELKTIGYKKYEKIQAGNFNTSGVSKFAWTIDANGNLIGNNLYAESEAVDENDESKIYAVKENPASLQEDYTISIKAKRVDMSRAQDRIGVMCWYVDDNNFLVYMLDHWRSDSVVPRTTFWGKINGDNLKPNRYTHGAWMPEGDADAGNGLTITESSLANQDHIYTVKKTGNTFSCSIDNNLGALSITVDLPKLTEGQKVSTGMYVLNDKVVFSEYGVYANDTQRVVSAPADPSQETDMDGEKAPELIQYDEADYVDEFTGNTSSGVEPPAPPTPDDGDDDNNGGETENKGCGSAATAQSVVIFGLMTVLAVGLFKIKSKKVL